MKVYLCIDLEATCFDQKVLGRDLTVEDMETIEIGVIAVNEAGETVGEFHSYVKPVYTEVSDYCTDLTGITLEALANAPHFDEMTDALRQWILSLPAWPDSWYSWGTYDLKQLELDASANRSNIALPLPSHRNAKKLFQKWQIRRGKQVGLLKALELVNLSFEGRHHSALADSRNVARLFKYFHISNPATD